MRQWASSFVSLGLLQYQSSSEKQEGQEFLQKNTTFNVTNRDERRDNDYDMNELTGSAVSVGYAIIFWFAFILYTVSFSMALALLACAPLNDNVYCGDEKASDTVIVVAPATQQATYPSQQGYTNSQQYPYHQDYFRNQQYQQPQMSQQPRYDHQQQQQQQQQQQRQQQQQQQQPQQQHSSIGYAANPDPSKVTSNRDKNDQTKEKSEASEPTVVVIDGDEYVRERRSSRAKTRRSKKEGSSRSITYDATKDVSFQEKTQV